MDAPALNRVRVASEAIGEFNVPSGTSRIDLSPNGQYVAAYRDADSGDEDSSTFQVGHIGGTLTSIEADDVAFVNDDHLLVLQSDSRGATLKTLRLGPSLDVVWEQFVEGVSAPSLSFDPATARWRVMGRGDKDSIVRAEGTVGTSDVQKTRWPAGDTDGGYIDAMTTAGPEMLVVEKRYNRSLLAHVVPWQWTWAHLLLLDPYNQSSSYATVSDRGRRTLGESKLGVDCLADVLDVLLEDGLACTVYDGTRTHIVRIAAGTGNVEGIGWLDGHFVGNQHVVRGWLTGWADAGAVAIRLTTGEVVQMPESAGAVSSVSVAGDRLAAVTMADSHFTVRVYALPPDTRTQETVRAHRAPY